jgi:hypothetical protein
MLLPPLLPSVRRRATVGSLSSEGKVGVREQQDKKVQRITSNNECDLIEDTSSDMNQISTVSI